MGLEGFEGGRVEGFSILAVQVFSVQTCDFRDVDSELLRVQADCLKWGCVLPPGRTAFKSHSEVRAAGFGIWPASQKAHEYPNNGALGPTFKL